MGLVRLVPARATDVVGAKECLRLPGARLHCCDSIQAATCLFTNEVGLAPVSNRVVTVSDEELVLVELQHERYMVSMSVSSQSHVMCSRVWEGSVLPP